MAPNGLCELHLFIFITLEIETKTFSYINSFKNNNDKSLLININNFLLKMHFFKTKICDEKGIVLHFCKSY